NLVEGRARRAEVAHAEPGERGRGEHGLGGGRVGTVVDGEHVARGGPGLGGQAEVVDLHQRDVALAHLVGEGDPVNVAAAGDVDVGGRVGGEPERRLDPTLQGRLQSTRQYVEVLRSGEVAHPAHDEPDLELAAGRVHGDLLDLVHAGRQADRVGGRALAQGQGDRLRHVAGDSQQGVDPGE